jgi:hypothetical protein
MPERAEREHNNRWKLGRLEVIIPAINGNSFGGLSIVR